MPPQLIHAAVFFSHVVWPWLFSSVHKADIEHVLAEADLFTRTAEFETFRLVTLQASVAELLVIGA